MHTYAVSLCYDEDEQNESLRWYRCPIPLQFSLLSRSLLKAPPSSTSSSASNGKRGAQRRKLIVIASRPTQSECSKVLNARIPTLLSGLLSSRSLATRATSSCFTFATH